MYLSTKSSAIPPVQVKSSRLPVGTLIHTGEHSFVANRLFLKRFTRGRPVPATQILTSRDFRRLEDLLAAYPGPVEIHGAEPLDLASYGSWDGVLLTPKN